MYFVVSRAASKRLGDKSVSPVHLVYLLNVNVNSKKMRFMYAERNEAIKMRI